MKAKFDFSSMTYKNQQKCITILFLLVPLLLLIVFTYLPLGSMIGYSFTKWNGYSPTKEFVGFDNYVTVFSRPEYFGLFKTSLYYLVGSFVQIGLALVFATLLSFELKAKNFFKGSLFFPYLINGVAVGFIFLYFFKPMGTLDSVLAVMGLDDNVMRLIGEVNRQGELVSPKWIGNPKLVNLSLAFASVWRYMGMNIVMFVGAIQSISSELYEASSLDGANKWQQFRYIIFPIIKPVINLNLLLAVKGALTVFEMPYIMTGGGNGSATFVTQTMDTAFKYQKVGLASAMAIVLLVIILVIALIQNIAFKEKKGA